MIRNSEIELQVAHVHDFDTSFTSIKVVGQLLLANDLAEVDFFKYETVHKILNDKFKKQKKP